MQHHYDAIRELLRRARRRWRTLAIFKASIRAALAAAAVVFGGFVASVWTAHAPLALAAIAVAVVIGALAAIGWGIAPLLDMPSDIRVARFVEERVALGDRLATAVDAVMTELHAHSPALADAMLADAARQAESVDLDAIVPSETLRRAGFQAAVAILAFGALLFVAREKARQGFDAATLALFPAHVRLDVTPGNVRVKAGTPVTIEARLVGNRAPVSARVQFGENDRWRTADMKATSDGRFMLALESVSNPFSYRVVAGPANSATYTVSVVRPPRVTRIDVDYTFPAGLGLEPRTEEDSGDIYAPAGTDVRVRIHTDKPAAGGEMALADGKSIPLSTAGGVLAASLTVVDDNSYRIALADQDGLSNPGETEYFIRTLEDRPPEVRIVKPATDRSVTRLEEVDIEAQADDDYGIDRMELVYAVGGGREQVLPFSVPKRATSVTAQHTLYLEDLKVQPGDMVSYYVRARDLTRGKRSSEAKSDIFFLEVKPFDQEFSLAQSQAMAGAGGGNKSIDDLVTAQKEIVVATWKLERRSQNAKGAKSEQDIRSVARAEAELKTRVEQTSSTFRESTMRDPRRRPQRGRGGQVQPRTPEQSASDALPEEDDMSAAAAAMQQAVTSLDALTTKDALPPEMDALNRLLKAQADVKKRQIARQQAGAGGGQNNRNYDLSTLFDRELQRTQQSNYETPNTTEQRDDANASLVDKVKELAQRQDELMKRQQELAEQRANMTEEELKRQLEKLTRDQLELRQRAEDLARQMNQRSGQQQPGQQKSGQQSGQQQSGQQQGGQQQAGQQSGQQQSNGAAGGMRSASEEMRNAAGGLRRQDPAQASASASRALQRLRELERQLQASRPDERRRAVGEMQLEARQLADNQRQVASELEKAGEGESAKDSLRRLAGEQGRLADRVRRLQDGLRQASSAPANRGGAPRPDARGDAEGDKNAQAAAGDAAREMDRQKLADRMQKSADQLRDAAGGQPSAGDPKGQAQGGVQDDRNQKRADARVEAGAQQEMARALDKLADRLASGTGSRDGDSQKLSEQLARAQELRDKLNSLSREMQQSASRQSGSEQSGSQQSGSRQAGGQPSASSQSTGQPSGSQPSGQGQSAQKTPGQTGQPNKGESGGTSGGNDLTRLREEYQRQLRETRDLLDQLRREDPNFNAQHGAGFTFEGQGMTLSAPGTEAFKQDFAKWEELRKQATQALENAQLSLSQKLQAKQSRDRLVSGVDDRAPADYQKQVDSYFKAIASKKKP